MSSIIGVCQMCVSSDKEANFLQGKELIRKCKDQGASMVFLPEACDYIAENTEKSVALAEKIEPFSCKENTVNKTICSRYADLARELNLWISLGGMHRMCNGDPPGCIRNTHVVLNTKGSIVCLYDKCHLFDVDIPEKVALKETNFTVPGKQIVEPFTTPAGVLGAMVCYDIRFPLMSSSLRKKGAEILTYPSAFTVPTGKAHWEVLLRARAIENQCYVVAAAQCGKHNSKRESYGHSIVVNPWGNVIGSVKDENEVGMFTAEIDIDYLHKLRTEMPVFQHSRWDLYDK